MSMEIDGEPFQGELLFPELCKCPRCTAISLPPQPHCPIHGTQAGVRS